jgi:hypothetical protein
MNTAVDYDRAVLENEIEEDDKIVRSMVLDSYQDMLAGKGRNYSDFFDELESRYKNA